MSDLDLSDEAKDPAGPRAGPGAGADPADTEHEGVGDSAAGSCGIPPFVAPLNWTPPTRYEIVDEIARGGMGVVFRARDVGLRRDLAVKVLHDSLQVRPDVTRRFVEEAQISGQLQHPGVVPVYDLGTLGDLRPYFTMKLVKGHTLAALLAGRASPAEDLPRFFAIFEKICQTVAYAHSKGIIHRDLKPQNIMVARFGEVLVMDWGLAKVVQKPERPRGEPDGSGEETAIGSTLREEIAEEISLLGELLGTPAYMAPEQARGLVDEVDERADVFGLGSILCKILTGEPTFTGSASVAVRKAKLGDTAEALARIDACGADEVFCDLARRCLSVDPGSRPRDASVVADTVTARLRSVQERLRAAEVARAEAHARLVEESKRRRLTVYFAAAVLTLVVLGCWGAWSYARQYQYRMQQVGVLLAEAGAHLDRAEVGGDDARMESEKADVALKSAELAAGGDAEPGTLARLAALRDRASHGRALRAFVARLESIRVQRLGHPDPRWAESMYKQAFIPSSGLNPDGAGPAEIRARLDAGPLAPAVAVALDDWSMVRLTLAGTWDDPAHRRLVELARVLDPDPYRDRIRSFLAHLSAGQLEELKRMAADAKARADLPDSSLILLSEALRLAGANDRHLDVLRLAWRRFPGNYWINLKLGWAYSSRSGRDSDRAEAIRYLSMAIAARPSSPATHNYLSFQLYKAGRYQEALEEATEASRLEPDDPVSHYYQGVALQAIGQHEKAIAEYRKASDLDGQHVGQAIRSLARLLTSRDRLDEAEVIYRRILDRIAADPYPDQPVDVLRSETRKEFARAYRDRGNARYAKKDYDGAIADYDRLIRLEPADTNALMNRGNARYAKKDYDGAIADYERVAGLDPGNAPAYVNLGASWSARREPDRAIAHYDQAIRLDPGYALAHYGRGIALFDEGEYEEAIASWRRARDLPPAASASPAAAIPETAGRIAQAERLLAMLKGEARPSDSSERLMLAEAAYRRRLYERAAREFAELSRSDPKRFDDPTSHCRYNAACSAALASSGAGKDDPRPDEAARAGWCRQSLDWLKAEIAAYSRVDAGGGPDDRRRAREALAFWKTDRDLAGIRDAAALERLPEEDRKAFVELWRRVDELLDALTRPNPAAVP